MTLVEIQVELVGKLLDGKWKAHAFTWAMNPDGTHGIDIPGVNVSDIGTYTLAADGKFCREYQNLDDGQNRCFYIYRFNDGHYAFWEENDSYTTIITGVREQ